MLKISAIDNRTQRRLILELISLWNNSFWTAELRKRPYGFSLVNRDSVTSQAHDGHCSKRASGK